jgi:DNA segregation ATPase FtsK/SpoIIIE-like protein
MTVENTDELLLSAEHLGGDLMGLCLQELKALPDVWLKLSEEKQRSVIDRVQGRVDEAVRQAVNLIAARGRTCVVADLAGVAIKAGVSATLKVSATTNSREALHSLYEATGQACLLVIASPEEFTGGMDDAHQPDPQQPAFNLDDDGVVDDEADAMYGLAVEHVCKTARASISSVQRGLGIGYNRAARLIELMEARGVVTPMDASGKRDVVLAVWPSAHSASEVTA